MVGSLHNMKHTEEEDLFLKKLNKLRKKKKALAALKSQKPEKSEIVSESPQLSTDVCPAVKQAEKLKQLAALKEASSSKDKTFKRTKRRKDSDSKPSVAFHPFSPLESDAHETNTPNPPKTSTAPHKFNLYENFVSSTEVDSQPEPKKFKTLAPKRGNTIYVFGYGINEKFLHGAFKKFGDIVHVTHEADKNCAFVTFENVNCAEEAINQMNETAVDEILIKVSMARKQPNFESTGESSNWSSIAASSSQKGSHKDRRNLVTYDEDPFQD